MRAVRTRKLQQAFQTMWTHQLGMLKEAQEIAGIQNVVLGKALTRVHWEEPNYRHCHFEELERGRAD